MTISPWLDALHPRRLFLDTWREVDAEARLLRTASPARAYDFRPLLALAVGAVCLLLMAHFGTSRYFFTLLETMPTDGGGARAAIAASPWRDLAAMTWWSGWRVLCYAVIPAMLIRFAWRERVRPGMGFFTEASVNLADDGIREGLGQVGKRQRAEPGGEHRTLGRTCHQLLMAVSETLAADEPPAAVSGLV